MLIVDGHQNRLDPKFIEYINDEGHKWIVCFGVLYATTLWQVGDASEQNGNFKSRWYEAKKVFVLWKENNGFGVRLSNTDVIPLLNRTFLPGRSEFV